MEAEETHLSLLPRAALFIVLSIPCQSITLGLLLFSSKQEEKTASKLSAVAEQENISETMET